MTATINEGGESYGRDPREMSRADLEKLGFSKQPLLRAIRAKCADCATSDAEVRKCVSVSCALWVYRMGTDPFSERRGNPEALQAARRKKEVIDFEALGRP